MNIYRSLASIIIGVLLCLSGYQPTFAQSTQFVSMTLRLQDAANATESTSEFTAAYTQADVSVLNVEGTSSTVQLLRHIEYSADQIVVVGLAADGTEKGRVVMIDPRLIRAESFITDDQWESDVVYRRSVDFSVALPDDPEIVTISVLKPRWTGSEWLFDILAGTAI